MTAGSERSRGLALQGGIKLSQQALACVGCGSLAALPEGLFSLALLRVSSFQQRAVISALCLSSLLLSVSWG